MGQELVSVIMSTYNENEFSFSELSAIDYINDNPEEFLKVHNLNDFCENKPFSATTIQRLAKKIGFSTATEMKGFYMTTRNKRPKRIAAAVLTSLFLTHQSMLISAIATTITNVEGVNGVYNINPTAIIKDNGQYTDIGYRKYQDFVLLLQLYFFVLLQIDAVHLL